MSNWCQFKTAYQLNSEARPVEGAIEWATIEDKCFGLFKDEDFPEGWELCGTMANPVFGFKLEFDIETLPTTEAMKLVESKIAKIADGVIMPCRNCGNPTGLKVWKCDQDADYYCSNECKKEWLGE